MSDLDHRVGVSEANLVVRHLKLTGITDGNLLAIVAEIEEDFSKGLSGIAHLPVEAKFGVYTAYIYYRKLLQKLKNVPSLEIKNCRVRVPNYQKAGLLAKSYISYRLNLI